MDLIKVTSNIYFYPAEGDSVNIPGPSVILIFGWMDAQMPHLRKYTEQYKLLFPNARQILVRSQGNIFWTRRAVTLREMEPVVALLRKEGLFEQSQSSILIHVFSNAGAHRLKLLSKVLVNEQPQALTTVGLIYDSLPGVKEPLPVLLTAFTAGIRSSLVKYLTYIQITLIWAVIRLKQFITRKPDNNEENRVALNTQNLLPWITPSTPRLYIYSLSDKVIPYTAVESHIAQAKQAGLNVMVEKFEGSGHVGHMRKDPKRYWEAVKQLWNSATSH